MSIGSGLIVPERDLPPCECTPEQIEAQIRSVWSEIVQVSSNTSMSDLVKTAELQRLMEVQNLLSVEEQRIIEANTRQYIDGLHVEEIGAQCFVTGGVKCRIEPAMRKSPSGTLGSGFR